MLSEMASVDSGTASHNRHIGFIVGSFVGGMFGSLAEPAVPEQGATLGTSVGEVLAGTAK